MKSSVNHKKKKKVLRKTVFEMVCLSDQKEITRVEKFLCQINTKIHLDDGIMYRLLVSCTEAVNNAIVHGNKLDPEKKVRVRCVVGKTIITIYITDEGKGFDPNGLQDPRKEENLLKENGRGVFLMRSLMDKVIFKQMKRGSIVEMKVKLHR